MSSTPNGCVAPDADVVPQTKKSTPTSDEECRIVITDSDIVIAIEAGDSLPMTWAPGKDTLSVSAFDDNISRKSDDQKHRHHHRHRRHHRDRSPCGPEGDPLASRCGSRLVVDDDLPSDCETVVTTKSESVWSQRKSGNGSDHRKRKHKRKRKKKRKRTPNEVEEDDDDDGERRDKKAELIVVTVSAVILTIAILLIGITLALTPKIDEMVRRENENLFRLPASTTVLTTAAPSTALPDNVTTLTSAG